MEAILKFNLDEPDDREVHMHSVNGTKYSSIIWDFDQWLREESKYADKEVLPIEEIRSKLREIISEHYISLELIFN